MGMTYTKVKATAPQEMQLNAGIICSDFAPATGVALAEDILGATTSGIQFSAVPSYLDFGDDIDNCPKNTMELKEIDDIEVKMTATFLSVTASLAKMMAGAADVADVESETYTAKKITPRKTLKNADFDDIWIIGDYGKGGKGYVAIHIMNGLNTGGFSMQTADKGKGQFAVDLTGHYSINAQDTVPYEIYIGTKDGDDDDDPESDSVISPIDNNEGPVTP